MYVITHNNNLYVFKNTRNEDYNMFIDRCWFIVKNMVNYDFKYLKNMSYIWVNYKYYNVIYEEKIMNELKKFI